MTVIHQGAARRIKRQHDENIWLAWHIAALTRIETLPEFGNFIAQKPKPRQTLQEQEQIIRAIQSAFESNPIRK